MKWLKDNLQNHGKIEGGVRVQPRRSHFLDEPWFNFHIQQSQNGCLEPWTKISVTIGKSSTQDPDGYCHVGNRENSSWNQTFGILNRVDFLSIQGGFSIHPMFFVRRKPTNSNQPASQNSPASSTIGVFRAYLTVFVLHFLVIKRIHRTTKLVLKILYRVCYMFPLKDQKKRWITTIWKPLKGDF